MTNSTSFETALSTGRTAETKIARWLMRRGFCVMPVYEKTIDEGKGPQVFLADSELVAPDMLIFKTGKTLWIEAKQKTRFTWHRISERWTTGIDLRHYQDYIRVRELSPWPLCILFLHTQRRAEEYPYDCPAGLFGQDLDYLRKHENHRSDRWGPSGMVYWAHENLRQFAEVDDDGNILP